MSADRFKSIFGLKNPTKPGTSSNATLLSPRPKVPTNSKQAAQREIILTHVEQQRILFQRAQDRRQRRLEKLMDEVGPARRFLKTLYAVEPHTTYTGYRDCDLDLAELAQDTKITALDDRDKRLLYGEAQEFVVRCAKRQGIRRSQYFNDAAMFDPPVPPHQPEAPALDQLMHVLSLH